MLLALPRLVLRALILGAGLAAVVLIWGIHQADAKEPPPLLDLGGGGINIDVPPIGPIDVPPINLGGGAPPPPVPTDSGSPPTGTPPPAAATPDAPTGGVGLPSLPVLDQLDPLVPDVPAAAQQLGLPEITNDVTDIVGQLAPALAPIIDLVDQAVLSPLTEGLDSAVDQLIGPMVAVVPRVPTTNTWSLPGPETSAPAAAPPPDPGAPATQSLATDTGRGPGAPGPPEGRAPPEPLGAPGPPLGTTGSTTSSNGNRLDAGVLVLGLVLALLLGFRPRDEAWWYAGVYQLEPLTRPG